MNEQFPIDPTELNVLINNPTVLKIVDIVNLNSLSMLELIEFNCTVDEINFCLKNKVITLEKINLPEYKSQHKNLKEVYNTTSHHHRYRLTELGIYILDLEEPTVQESSFTIEEPELGSNQKINDL